MDKISQNLYCGYVRELSSGCYQLLRSYCPLIAFILRIFSIPSHNLVSNGWNLMKLVLSICDYGVVIHLKVCQDILSNRSYCPLIA